MDHVPAGWPRDPALTRVLGEVDWATLLAGRPGWTFDAAKGEILCEDGRVLTLTTVRKAGRSQATTSVIFRRPWGGCEACPARPGCLDSEREGASKHAEFAIANEIAERLRARLKLVRAREPEPSRIAPVSAEPGPRAVNDALFPPARARRALSAIFHGATLHVDVDRPDRPPRPQLVALHAGDRQHRRRTWEQNVDRYALPEGARMSLHVAAGPGLRFLLGDAADQVHIGVRAAS